MHCRVPALVYAGAVAEATQLRSRVRDRGLAIAIAMSIMNIATYGYQMATARVLGPQEFGAFAALMNLLLVVSVVSLGAQATAARRIAADPGHVVEIERSVLRVGYRLALILGVVLLALSPVINLALRLDSLSSAALIGASAVPLTIMGAQAGVLQGERRWGPLAVLYIAAGVPRLVIGTALVVWHPSEATAMLGVAIGATVPVIVGMAALRRPRAATHDTSGLGARPILGELCTARRRCSPSSRQNLDVIVARNVLNSREAGLYAAGLIMTKAVLFLPQFVVVVAFPTMSSERQRGRTVLRASGLVAGVGLVAIAGAWLLSTVAMIFVGGDKYVDMTEACGCSPPSAPCSRSSSCWCTASWPDRDGAGSTPPGARRRRDHRAGFAGRQRGAAAHDRGHRRRGPPGDPPRHHGATVQGGCCRPRRVTPSVLYSPQHVRSGEGTDTWLLRRPARAFCGAPPAGDPARAAPMTTSWS